MIRNKLAPLHESSRTTVRAGGVIGGITGALCAASSVAATSNVDAGYATVLFGSIVGAGILLVLGVLFGVLVGVAIGAIEAGASYAIALIAAGRGLTARSVFIAFGLICAVMNTVFALISAVALLGLTGTHTGDYLGPTLVTVATLATAALFGWAQSLDWPEPIDLRDHVAERSVRVDRTSDTLQHDGLVGSRQSRLYDEL